MKTASGACDERATIVEFAVVKIPTDDIEAKTQWLVLRRVGSTVYTRFCEAWVAYAGEFKLLDNGTWRKPNEFLATMRDLTALGVHSLPGCNIKITNWISIIEQEIFSEIYKAILE